MTPPKGPRRKPKTRPWASLDVGRVSWEFIPKREAGEAHPTTMSPHCVSRGFPFWRGRDDPRGRAPLPARLRAYPCAENHSRLEKGLTESERYAVADHVISQLKERGDPWGLNEEAKSGGGHTTPDMTPR